jgi:SagB-type dehydrogenase family enzyme
VSGSVMSAAEASSQRPRLCPGLAVIRDGDALLVIGGPRRQRFTGGAAASVLARLLALADGSRTPGMLAAELGLTADQVGEALGLLGRCELLEMVEPERPEPCLAGHVRSHLARNLTRLGAQASSGDLAAQLARAAVLVVAPSPLAGHLRADLTEMGIGRVLAIPAAGQAAPSDLRRLTDGRRAVAVVIDRPGLDELPAALVTLARTDNLPVIRFSWCEHQIEIGPSFNWSGAACFECFRRGQTALAEAGRLGCCRSQAAPGSAAAAGSMHLAAGLVGAHVLEVLSAAHRALRPRSLARIDVRELSCELFDVLPEPGCIRCGIPPAEDGAAYWPAVYEWQMAARTGLFGGEEPVSAERARQLDLLQIERSTRKSLPRVGLPSPSAIAEQAPDVLAAGVTEAVRIDAAMLSGILSRVAGRRTAGSNDSSPEQERARWAPSGGNLASVELYVAAEPNPFGLPGTVVKYDDLEHQAVSVWADPVPLTHIAACTDLCVDPGTDALIMLTAAAGRLRKKYADFSWRLSHLDAGCAALQLSLVATSQRLNVRFASAWSAELAALIGLDPDSEIVTAVGRLRLAAPESEVRSPCQ